VEVRGLQPSVSSRDIDTDDVETDKAAEKDLRELVRPRRRLAAFSVAPPFSSPFSRFLSFSLIYLIYLFFCRHPPGDHLGNSMGPSRYPCCICLFNA
jgi:hypothetical protein